MKGISLLLLVFLVSGNLSVDEAVVVPVSGVGSNLLLLVLAFSVAVGGLALAGFFTLLFNRLRGF